MDESESEEFPGPAPGDYVIVTDELIGFPGKFDKYCEDPRYGWVTTMTQAENNYWKWPEETSQKRYHMIDIELVPEPTKLQDNKFFFPTL